MVERRWLSVERVALGLKLGPDAPKHFTMAQLSDLHLDPQNDEAWVTEYVAATNALKPDLIGLTGDYITHDDTAMGRLLPLLSQLQAPGGVFACLGNHDQWSVLTKDLVRQFGATPIKLLRNQFAAAAVQGGQVLLSGLESCWAGMIEPHKAFAFHKGDAPQRSILLAHEPDVARLLPADSPCALQISGHTHGGQCALPPGIAIKLPKYGRIYTRGLYQKSHAWDIYVNRGVGGLWPHLRVAARPEITLFEITNQSLV
jgi:hypothetical protein